MKKKKGLNIAFIVGTLETLASVEKDEYDTTPEYEIKMNPTHEPFIDIENQKRRYNRDKYKRNKYGK